MNTSGAALALIEWSVNRALAADPEVRERLAALDGARIRIVPEPGLPPLEIAVHGERLALGRPAATETGEGARADLTISGPLPALARLFADRGLPDGTLPPGVRTSGDLTLARDLRRLARSHRIDWEEALSHCLGDPGAHEVARGTRAAARWVRGAAGTLARNVAEYLVEERAMVAGEPALQRFFDAVDELRDDVERLEARIAALSRRAEDEGP